MHRSHLVALGLWLLVNGGCNPLFRVISGLMWFVPSLVLFLAALAGVSLANAYCASRYRGITRFAFAAAAVLTPVLGIWMGSLGIVQVLASPDLMIAVFQSLAIGLWPWS
jgi:hypothetical protein